MIDAKTTKDLQSIRRCHGAAPSAMSAGRLMTVLELVGWTVAKRRVDRSTVYDITAPNGATCELTRLRSLYTIASFLKEHGFEKAVCDLLGVPTLTEEAEAKAAAKKTSERRFTCGCCFGEFKTEENPRSDRFGKLVRHGFKRPGHGYIEGGCLGEFTVPFEVSKETTEKFLAEYVQPALDKAKARLELLESEPESFEHVEGYGRRAKLVTVSKSDQGYAWKLHESVGRAKSDVRVIQRDVDTLQAKLDAWFQTWIEIESVDTKADAVLAYRPVAE